MTQTTRSPSDARQLASWDAARQEQYRAQHASMFFHFLLDASPSMMREPGKALRLSFNLYTDWLKANCDPMSLADVRCFSGTLDASEPVALGLLKPLTTHTYDPAQHGSGTALYMATHNTCIWQATVPGQHVLVVFTDGLDNISALYRIDAGMVAELLHSLQDKSGWLCVFLGAFPEALDVGKQMGFAPGNCLVFGTDEIPAAFWHLRQATQKYLAAAPAERKLLAAGGIF